MARRERHAHDGWGGEVLIGSRLFLSGLLFSMLLFSRLLLNGLLFHRLFFNGSTLALLGSMTTNRAYSIPEAR